MISCKEYAEIKKKELKENIDLCKEKPCLVVIQIDDDQASNSYIKGKRKDCDEVGIIFIHKKINSDTTTQSDLERIVTDYNNNIHIDGIIIQLPIPDKYNLEKLKYCISRVKDVDGFRGDSLHKPCTPRGIIDWLEYNKIDLKGKEVCVLGRSEIVGKPLVNMLIDKGATVISCNSSTHDVPFYTNYADIVISAIGKPKFLGKQYFTSFNQIVVDVGINRDNNGKLCGDVNKESILEKLPYIYVTPVPGGVGLLTRISLMQNVYDAYKNDY